MGSSSTSTVQFWIQEIAGTTDEELYFLPDLCDIDRLKVRRRDYAVRVRPEIKAFLVQDGLRILV